MTSQASEVGIAARLTRAFQGKRLPPGLGDHVREALQRIQVLETNQQNYTMIDSLAHWLQTILDLPWYELSEDTMSLEQAKEIMDNGHYGMDKIKARILDFISVQKLTQGNARGLVLCFVGPPGTGKTTISKIIAKSLGRKFERISMAALGDMSQLRGRSRFQADAEPSLIIKAILHAGVRNPVICLDEIDKTGGGGGQGMMGGEAMAAFLEILDPEQNYAFNDHYVDFPFDLSKVLFVSTANKLLASDNPVINRIEMITLPDYTRADKEVIGKTFIIPEKMEETGLVSNGVNVNWDESIWPRLLDPSRWESGMRTLQHQIGEICQKIARQVVETGKKEYEISAQNLSEYIIV